MDLRPYKLVHVCVIYNHSEIIACPPLQRSAYSHPDLANVTYLVRLYPRVLPTFAALTAFAVPRVRGGDYCAPARGQWKLCTPKDTLWPQRVALCLQRAAVDQRSRQPGNHNFHWPKGRAQ